MIRLKNPPSIKVLEAAGAIGDGRVHIEEEHKNLIVARVISSQGDRNYKVIIKKVLDGYTTYSDDNGTRFRKYIGYPIISVFMIAGILPRSNLAEEFLKGIPWKKLNETYKKYSLVEEIIFSKIKDRAKVEEIKRFQNEVMSKLRDLVVYYDPSLGKGS